MQPVVVQTVRVWHVAGGAGCAYQGVYHEGAQTRVSIHHERAQRTQGGEEFKEFKD